MVRASSGVRRAVSCGVKFFFAAAVRVVLGWVREKGAQGGRRRRDPLPLEGGERAAEQADAGPVPR